jgi:hypothetical protein
MMLFIIVISISLKNTLLYWMYLKTCSSNLVCIYIPIDHFIYHIDHLIYSILYFASLNGWAVYYIQSTSPTQHTSRQNNKPKGKQDFWSWIKEAIPKFGQKNHLDRSIARCWQSQDQVTSTWVTRTCYRKGKITIYGFLKGNGFFSTSCIKQDKVS